MAAAMGTPPAYPLEPDQHYRYTDLHSTPAYSDTPYASERVLVDSASISSYVTHDNNVNAFVYHSDHMDVNLGSRVWGLRMPAYGREGHVEGFVKLSGEESHIMSVQVKVNSNLLWILKSLTFDNSATWWYIHPNILLWSSLGSGINTIPRTNHYDLLGQSSEPCCVQGRTSFLLRTPFARRYQG